MLTIDHINYLTYKESAQLLGVTIMTIRRWVKAGKLIPLKMSPRKIFIKESNLKEVLK